jgi:hypothetical protein
MLGHVNKIGRSVAKDDTVILITNIGSSSGLKAQGDDHFLKQRGINS